MGEVTSHECWQCFVTNRAGYNEKYKPQTKYDCKQMNEIKGHDVAHSVP